MRNGGRFLKESERRFRTASRTLRNAVVYDVNEAEAYCRVKIQGSNQYITAFFKENWGAIPSYLKPGNSIRISTPDGDNSRVEVESHGTKLITTMPGGTPPPDSGVSGSGVLTGMALYPADTGFTVYVSTGSFMIDGGYYYLGSASMDDALIEMDDPAVEMGGIGGSVSFSAISSTQYRYDVIYIGIDSELHVLEGIPSTGEPVMPTAIPNGHVALGWVLFHPNQTDILPSDIGLQWSAPLLTAMSISGTLDLAWGVEYTDITVTMVNQYGNVMAGNYILTITEPYSTGNGTLNKTSPISFTGSTVIRYTKYSGCSYGAPCDDVIPSLYNFSESTLGTSRLVEMTLRDGYGDIIYPTF